jgi:hypothetical protein
MKRRDKKEKAANVLNNNEASGHRSESYNQFARWSKNSNPALSP